MTEVEGNGVPAETQVEPKQNGEVENNDKPAEVKQDEDDLTFSDDEPAKAPEKETTPVVIQPEIKASTPVVAEVPKEEKKEEPKSTPDAKPPTTDSKPSTPSTPVEKKEKKKKESTPKSPSTPQKTPTSPNKTPTNGDFTYSPTIAPHPSLKNRSGNIYNKLYQDALDRRQKRKEKIEQVQKDKVAQASSPQLSEKAKQAKRGRNVFESLYADAEQRRVNRKKKEEEFAAKTGRSPSGNKTPTSSGSRTPNRTPTKSPAHHDD